MACTRLASSKLLSCNLSKFQPNCRTFTDLEETRAVISPSLRPYYASLGLRLRQVCLEELVCLDFVYLLGVV